jgi:hypothetical protein
MYGYLLGAVLMIGAGVVEIFLASRPRSSSSRTSPSR